LHAFLPTRHRRAATWLTAILGALCALLLMAAASRAEDNPNNYQCFGHIAAGQAEAGSTEQQVEYSISCSGPITGYQLQTQIPLSGFESSPLVTNLAGQPVTTDSFSCDGEFPGYAVNCVGSTTAGFETISGQFSIGSKLCVEPRVDPLLTVTDAYLNEKKVITQAISGPFDLGRPHGCPASANGGGNRLDPITPNHKSKGKKHTHTKKPDSAKKKH
jgi:hypothetical protein